MTEAKRLGAIRRPGPDNAVHLKWDPGINELAAIVDTHNDGRAEPRAVTFRLHSTSTPRYLHPLHPFYEPLSYLLWIPAQMQ
eukprot:2497590-Pyramimonas_sp.AAC.1